MAEQDPVISLQDVVKRFEGRAVLDGVSFDVERGQTLVVMGGSGCGKSTLLRTIIGSIRPDSGTIRLWGEPVHELDPPRMNELRKRFGVLFQGGALFDSMSTFENIAFPLRYFSSLDEAGIQDRVQECLDLVHLPDVGDKNPTDLSGGMRKRVALARAIAIEPEYILYDEPTSGLDPETSNTINDLIRHLTEELNVTSVVVTHDMHSVLSIADRVAFLHEGALEWVGPVSDSHDCSNPHLNSFVEANEYQVGSTTPALSGPSA